MGVIHRPHPDWASHIPVLIKALSLTTGPVVELGMGINSTPLLHALCVDQDRRLVSYDNDGRFTDMFKNFKTDTHDIYLAENWQDVALYWPWGVAFVDSKPAEVRKEQIKQLVHAELVVVHDTQERADEFYGFEEIYPLFKFRYDYTKFENQTTVLSNKIKWPEFHS